MLGFAQIAPLPKSPGHVALVSAARQVRPGSTFEVALDFKMRPGWHIYWENPGESGQAPSVDWHLPKGWKAGPIEWPTPKRLDTAGVVTYAYENSTMLLTKISVPAGTTSGRRKISGRVSWLVCREGCIPAKADVSTSVEVGPRNVPAMGLAATFELEKIKRFPRAATGIEPSATRTKDTVMLTLTPRAPVTTVPSNIQFFPADTTVEPSAPQPATKRGRDLVLQLKVSSYAPAKIDRLRGLLVTPSGSATEIGARAIVIDIPLLRTKA
jgi:thiol:disulfide interchange protein DsbD